MSRFLARADLTRGTFSASGMTRHDGCRVVSRGFIANAAALRSEARTRAAGAPFGNDALFALAYRRWGEDLAQHVLGEYAVAVYDERARVLVVTHDALGLVPCFIGEHSGTVVAGSHLDDVVRALGASELDDEYVADLLALGRPSTGGTPYRGVRRLLPGRTVSWTGERVRERTTWQLGNVEPVRFSSDGEYEERCRALIAEGVRTALDDEGTTWCELSGGLDSSTVISTAAALCGRDLPAVSTIYERDAAGDERPWMQAVLDRYELRWHPIAMDGDPPFAQLPSIAFPEPNAVMPLWPYQRRFHALLERHGVSVVLTGCGGDQVLAGDNPPPRHLSDALLRGDAAGFARGVQRWKRGHPARRSLAHWISRDVVAPLVRHARGRSVLVDGGPLYTIPPWIDERFARSTGFGERMQRRYAPRCKNVGDQFFAEMLYVLGTIAGTHRDAVSEHFEYRNPLLYRPLVEFLFATPWEQRLRPEFDRSLHRRAMRGVLPEKVRRRRSKTGAAQSYFDGLRNGAWLDILRRPQLVERGYLEPRAWSEAVEQARFGRAHTMSHLISAATLECWFRQRDTTTTQTASSGSQGAPDERPEILFRA
jgi:asparagine synthase (glutamine-hydrolysing)